MSNELGSNKIKFSFHTYDFLGYFLPGAMFLTIVFLFEYFLKKYFFSEKFYPLLYSLVSLSKDYFLDKNSHWAFEIIILVLFIVFCYSIGHIIASFSAFFLDRLLVGKCFKYPYVIFFKLEQEYPNRHSLKRVLFFVVFVINFLLILNIFFKGIYLIVITFVIIILLLLVAISYINKIYYSENYDEFKVAFNDYKISSFISKLFDMKLTRIIINPIKHLLQFSLNIYRPLDDHFIIKFKSFYHEAFGDKLEDDKVRCYWNCRNYILENGGLMNDMLNNWFNLYSYARNLSTCIYIAFIYIILIILYQSYVVMDKNFVLKFYSNELSVVNFKILLLFLFIISNILVLRYYYLYYTYYNKYLFRTFVYLFNKNHIKSER